MKTTSDKRRETPKQTVEAKVWPPFSDESAKKAVSHLRSTLAPSPNEAPKGEAEEHIFCDCPIHKGSICIIHNHYCKKSAPDKEWEARFDKEFDVYVYPDQTEIPCFRNMDALNPDNIKKFIRKLLKAKDQEADRRIEKMVDILAWNVTVNEGEEQPEDKYHRFRKYEITKEKLLNILKLDEEKLSPSHKEEEK